MCGKYNKLWGCAPASQLSSRCHLPERELREALITYALTTRTVNRDDRFLFIPRESVDGNGMACCRKVNLNVRERDSQGVVPGPVNRFTGVLLALTLTCIKFIAAQRPPSV